MEATTRRFTPRWRTSEIGGDVDNRNRDCGLRNRRDSISPHPPQRFGAAPNKVNFGDSPAQAGARRNKKWRGIPVILRFVTSGRRVHYFYANAPSLKMFAGYRSPATKNNYFLGVVLPLDGLSRVIAYILSEPAHRCAGSVLRCLLS